MMIMTTSRSRTRSPLPHPHRAAAPATRPLCASRGQARPRPASCRSLGGRLRLSAPRKPPSRRPTQRLARAAPAKARAAPAEAHRRLFAAPARLRHSRRTAPAAFRCVPQGGSNPWAVPAGDRGPLSREFSQNSGVGVLAPKQKKTAPKDDLWWYSQWLFEPVIAGALAAAFSCQFAGRDQLAKCTLDGADTQ